MEGQLKILLLEDSETDAEIVQRLIKQSNPNCEFKLVMNERAYIHALEAFQPDLILSDNSMPQFSAAEALEIKKDLNLQIPFILVTGTVSEEFAAGIIKRGADDYLLKDRLTRLPAAIDAALKQKKAEREREFDRDNLAALINNTNDLMWSLNKNFQLITFNNSFKKAVYELTGQSIKKGFNILSDRTDTGYPGTFKKFYERAFSGESFTETVYAYGTWSEISFYPIYSTDKIIGTACFSRDITQRKKAEEDLKAMEKNILDQKIQEQKKISRAIILAQEQERNHLGQELHDNITQILAGTKMYLSIAISNNHELSNILKYPMELIDNSINEIRLLSHRQVTPLKNINLEELINVLLDNFNRSNAIKINFIYHVFKAALSDDLKLNIYRVIQEQLNNILKHADAKNVSITIEEKGRNIIVVVSDDGKGFIVTKKRKGVGISNMINRVKSFNGKIVIKSSPGNGAIITAKIPC